MVIYTATAGGISAAIQTARMGKKPVVIEPGRHLGGMTSGGLGATDIGNKRAIGGISRQFYQRVLKYYRDDNAWRYQPAADYLAKRRKPEDDAMWTFEPHVAEAIFARNAGRGQSPRPLRRSVWIAARAWSATERRIVSIRMETGETYRAPMFIDAGYEGDLMAAAGVSYHVGREASATYGESLNGVQLGSKQHQFKVDVDPYLRPGQPESGLLPGVHCRQPGRAGARRRASAGL